MENSSPAMTAKGLCFALAFAMYIGGIFLNIYINSSQIKNFFFYFHIASSLCVIAFLFYLFFTENRKNEQLKCQLDVGAGQLSALINSLPDMIWICNKKSEYVDVNRTIVEEIDLPEKMIIGKTPMEVWQDDIARKFVKDDQLVLKSRETVQYEQTFLDANGNRGWVRIIKSPVCNRKNKVMGFVGIARDITQQKYIENERKELESQLRQSQKMEAIGTLAGGIAHDFNNILAAVMGYAEISLTDLPTDHIVYSRLDRILKASHRGKELVTQILTFSRQHEQQKQLVKMDFIMDEALAMLRHIIPSSIEISYKKNGEPCMIHADPTQIHQVLMNLCTNSAYAMRQKGGKLDLRLEPYEINEYNQTVYNELREGLYTRLTVSDTGPGIPLEAKNRIFEPFFTTKKQGEGTGMGLAVVHGIIKSLNGGIYLASEPGKGATFQILIPRVNEDLKEETPRIPLISIGNEKILFVDDEEPIVEMAHEMLERLGYDVISVKNSEEALALFRRQHNQFNLVVTDLTMPNMTGEELAREMLRIRSDIPIIMCTGFSEVVPPEKAKEMGIKEYIMKPFLNRELAVSIRRILDNPQEAESERAGRLLSCLADEQKANAANDT